jgi:hypothetical protein
VRRSPKETYLQFIELEDKAAAIYLRLASTFASKAPRMSGFWLDMAMEEKQHAVLLQFCVAEKWFAPQLPEESEIRKFYAQFREFERRATNRNLNSDAAFSLAAEMEGSEINAIYCHLTTPLHASAYLFKKKIATSPFDHIGHLATAGKRFKVAASTMKKLEGLRELCRNAKAA